MTDNPGLGAAIQWDVSLPAGTETANWGVVSAARQRLSFETVSMSYANRVSPINQCLSITHFSHFSPFLSPFTGASYEVKEDVR